MDHFTIASGTTAPAGEPIDQRLDIVLRTGRDRLRQPDTSAVPTSSVGRLERLVASCRDVGRFRFDGMTVRRIDGPSVRRVDVHAIVEGRGFTCLTSVQEDGPDAFWGTCLLEAAATQLDFLHSMVTPMAVECSSPTFGTLLAVSDCQHIHLAAREVGRIAGVFETRGGPTLADVDRALGGGSRGRRRALAAVAHGLVRFAPHVGLDPTVPVHPGPMLADRGSDVAGRRGPRPDGEAA